MAAGTNATDWLERAALGASAACLAHCLALPILFALLPSLSAQLDIPESIHLWLLAAAVPMAIVALHKGRKAHRGNGPPLAGILGLVLMAAGATVWGETRAEVPLTVAGSAILACAHLTNWRRRHGCGC